MSVISRLDLWGQWRISGHYILFMYSMYSDGHLVMVQNHSQRTNILGIPIPFFWKQHHDIGFDVPPISVSVWTCKHHDGSSTRTRTSEYPNPPSGPSTICVGSATEPPEEKPWRCQQQFNDSQGTWSKQLWFWATWQGDYEHDLFEQFVLGTLTFL